MLLTSTPHCSVQCLPCQPNSGWKETQTQLSLQGERRVHTPVPFPVLCHRSPERTGCLGLQSQRRNSQPTALLTWSQPDHDLEHPSSLQLHPQGHGMNSGRCQLSLIKHCYALALSMSARHTSTSDAGDKAKSMAGTAVALSMAVLSWHGSPGAQCRAQPPPTLHRPTGKPTALIRGQKEQL